MSETETKPGRPTDYSPKYCQKAQELCANGATDQELADYFDVSARTIYRWKADHPEFCQALKSGKEVADERVERSLYNRAVGYTFESEKVFQFQGQIVRTPVKEHVPPDTTAAIFWLKNRRAKEWRDIRQHEVGKPGDFEQMSDEELMTAISEEAAQLPLLAKKTKANGRGNGTAH